MVVTVDAVLRVKFWILTDMLDVNGRLGRKSMDGHGAAAMLAGQRAEEMTEMDPRSGGSLSADVEA
jgi:hypothetical protein